MRAWGRSTPAAQAARLAALQPYEEEEMAKPECPQPQANPVITGYITPGSDSPAPIVLGAGIDVEVVDPTENDERIRVIETDDPFSVLVDWCICGPAASMICGCWIVDVCLNGKCNAPTYGWLEQQRVDVQTAPPDATRCYNARFEIPAGTVAVDPKTKTSVYELVVVITLNTGDCDRPKPTDRRVGDMLLFGEIPVLVFFESPGEP
jgi:hypothetical protein